MAVLTAGVLATSGCGVAARADAKPPGIPAAAKYGGVLRVGVTTPGSLDPIEAYDASARLILRTMCDTYVVLDPVTGEAKPGLARGFVVSDDGTTITLKLRKNLHSSDGRLFTARDAVTSLSRLASLANASASAKLLEPVAGYRALNDKLLADVSEAKLGGAQALNNADLQIRLARPDGGFLRALADIATAPVSRSASDRDARSFGDRPSCIGPYRLTRAYHTADRVIVLERVAGYHGASTGYTGGGRGYADRVEFHLFPNDAAVQAAYVEHKIDAAPLVGTAARRSGADIVTGNAAYEEFVGLPAGLDGPFAKPAVRQALSAAIDRERLVSAVWGPARIPASGFLPPALGKGYRGNACNSTAPTRGNPGLARRALATATSEGAGITKSPLTLYINSDYAYPKLAEELARQWKDVLGLRILVKPMRWVDYIQQGTTQGFTGAFRLSWSLEALTPDPSYNDPKAFLVPLFGSTRSASGNWSHWANGKFDTRVEEDLVPITDPLTRRQEFQKLERELLCPELPLIPLAYGQSVWAVNKTRWASARASYLSVEGNLLVRELYQR